MICLKIDNKEIFVEENSTILDASKLLGIRIPTLCYLRDVNEIASCRVCIVEDNKTHNLMTACSTKVKEGMDLSTNSEKVIKSRINTLELIAGEHDKDCDNCERNTNCELQDLLYEYKIEGKKYSSKNKKDIKKMNQQYI